MGKGQHRWRRAAERAAWAGTVVLLLAWQTSVWAFVEWYHRRTGPHVRMVSLAAEVLHVAWSEGSAAGACDWRLEAHWDREPLRGLAWWPRWERSSWPGDAAYVSVSLPLWMPAAAGLGMAGWMSWRRAGRARRLALGRCPRCWYDVRDLGPGAERCPECGERRAG